MTTKQLIQDNSVKEDIVYFGTATYYTLETYRTKVPLKSRWQALKSLLRGWAWLEWQVPSNKKDKTIKIKGERVVSRWMEK